MLRMLHNKKPMTSTLLLSICTCGVVYAMVAHSLSLSLSLSALLSTSVGDHGSPSGPIFCQSQDVNVLQGAISLGDVAQYTAFVDETLVLLSSSAHYAWTLFVFANKLLTRLQ